METRHPSLSNRTLSSPFSSASMYMSPRKDSSEPMLAILTPPASPRQTRSSTDLTKCHSNHACANEQFQPQMTQDGLPICPFDVEILRDRQGRSQIFGQGAWSTVFQGACRQKVAHRSGLATPPPSSGPRPPLVVAVKKPSRKDAIPILTNEAKILHRLTTVTNHGLHVVTFYGILAFDSSIVLAAHPLSLEQYVQSCAKRATATLTTSNMFLPVVGSTQTWLELTYKLVSTLEWLHNEAQIVHGDIKPGNILFQPTEAVEDATLPYQPLLVDFSSAQFLDGEEISPNTLSAVTREYTAPELLTSAVLRDPNSTATTASDVFSLAVTLLVAATGDTMVYSGSVYQRQTFATQGWQVIDFVRNGGQGSRVPRHGIVSRALEQAVLKKDMGRISATRWKSHIERMMADEEPPKL